MPRQPPIATTTSATRTSSRPDGVSAGIRAFKPSPIPRRGFRWSPGWCASSDRPRLLPGAISVKAFTSCRGLPGRERVAIRPGRYQQAGCERKVRRFTFTTSPHSTSRRESGIEALQQLLRPLAVGQHRFPGPHQLPHCLLGQGWHPHRCQLPGGPAGSAAVSPSVAHCRRLTARKAVTTSATSSTLSLSVATMRSYRLGSLKSAP
jgi:hypothetical protein